MPVYLECSDVGLFDSNQAQGYIIKSKYHLCICPIKGRFFFISSKMGYQFRELCLEITTADWPQMPNRTKSYLSTNFFCKYDSRFYDNVLASGRCTDAFMRKLYCFISSSKTMPPIDKLEALGLLRSYSSP